MKDKFFRFSANIQRLGGLHRRVDIKKWPKENVIKYWSKKENWKNGQANYATSKLLEQYAVNEIAKLACDADGR
jgi:hypothetical protein